MMRAYALGWLLLTLVSAQPARAADENEEVLGRLGNSQVTSSDIRRLLGFQGADARRQYADSLVDLEKLVRAELIRKSLAAEARDKGVDKRAEVKFLMERAREQALISAYIQRFVQPPADYPSEDLLKTAYEQNKANLMAPAQYQIASIYMADAGGQGDAVPQKLEELAVKLSKDPVQFEQMAKEHSQDKTTAPKGGGMGWVQEKILVPEARAQLEKMEKGAVTKPIRGRTGWSLIKLIDKRPARQRTFEESRKVLAATMRMRKMQENERAYLENTVQKAPINIQEAELARMQATLAK